MFSVHLTGEHAGADHFAIEHHSVIMSQLVWRNGNGLFSWHAKNNI
jgi:hypothetical protein